MIRNKYKKKRIGYKPVTTSKNPKKRKKHDFVSKGQNESVNITGMELENASVKQKDRYFLVGLIIGFVLLIFDVRDNGMMVEFLGIKYTGSLVGGVIALACIIGIFRNKSKVSISN